MARISKEPEVRKQEIIDTAMKLFTQKGYENTSIQDIAKEMNVVSGLCYRYFSSKQEIFYTAMEQYVKAYCKPFIEIFTKPDLNLRSRLSQFWDIARRADTIAIHSNLLHQKGYEMIHDDLTIRICRTLIPYVRDELLNANKNGEISVINVDFAAEFIMYGTIALWECSTVEFEQKLEATNDFLESVLKLVP